MQKRGVVGRVREWWLDRKTDRMARRPRGRRAKVAYGAPDAHSFTWEPVLDALRLGPPDVLLDAGCGGGAFLRRALETGCRAAGVDHSRTMVRLARKRNADAVADGRLRIVRGTVEDLPFRDGEFTAISCLVAFLFFERPIHALREMRRVLDRDRGRLAIFTIPPELRGTPAAPHPVSVRAHFYSDAELQRLPIEAGFAESRITRTDIGGQLLTATG
jgi:ubiquinone/menaquinone biosynthesis C-methylase UbiE